jgi:hypothetical protein
VKISSVLDPHGGVRAARKACPAAGVSEFDGKSLHGLQFVVVEDRHGHRLFRLPLGEDHFTRGRLEIRIRRGRSIRTVLHGIRTPPPTPPLRTSVSVTWLAGLDRVDFALDEPHDAGASLSMITKFRSCRATVAPPDTARSIRAGSVSVLSSSVSSVSGMVKVAHLARRELQVAFDRSEILRPAVPAVARK